MNPSDLERQVKHFVQYNWVIRGFVDGHRTPSYIKTSHTLWIQYLTWRYMIAANEEAYALVLRLKPMEAHDWM
jgi:hypothetical protein